MTQFKKIVLAYSGGLDTSVILKWLQENYRCEVVAFLADLGQEEDLQKARHKAEALGAQEIVIEDLREEFTRDYVFPMLRANALYEGRYMLGTAIARPLIAKKQVEVARRIGADALCHGATGKGNDQIRFELAYAALAPDLAVIAPWRLWDMATRPQLAAYAQQHQIPIDDKPADTPPFSADANLLHHSSEGNILENIEAEAPEDAYQISVAPEKAPDEPAFVDIGFAQGDAISLDGAALSPALLLQKLNQLGGAHGIGRIDMIENRTTGMKSRGVYETPGGTILHHAHRTLEEITLDASAAHLKDQMMPLYAELIYKGLWFSPEREMLQALIDVSQKNITGKVRLKLYKGNIWPVARSAEAPLYDREYASFDEAALVYDHKDAEGFIRLAALRLKLLYWQKNPRRRD